MTFQTTDPFTVFPSTVFSKPIKELVITSATALAVMMVAGSLSLAVPAHAQVSADADVSVGGDDGVSADTDANVGGGGGVDASADASVGGGDGVDADVDASVGGGDGVDANVDANVGGSADANADVDVGVGDGANADVNASVGALDDLIGPGAATDAGTTNLDANTIIERLGAMDSDQRAEVIRTCEGVMVNPSAFGSNIQALCALIADM